MNVSENKRKPKYVCDKCGNEIVFVHRKGFVSLNKYYKQKPNWDTVKKDFDLCDNCEKKFRKWLKEKEVPTVNELLNIFPNYEEVQNEQ